MNREEVVEKMCDAYERRLLRVEKDSCAECMAAALDVAIGELLAPKKNASCEIDAALNSELYLRRSRYLPKSDPAVEAARKAFDEVWCNELCRGVSPGKACAPSLDAALAAFRKADAK